MSTYVSVRAMLGAGRPGHHRTAAEVTPCGQGIGASTRRSTARFLQDVEFIARTCTRLPWLD